MCVSSNSQVSVSFSSVIQHLIVPFFCLFTIRRRRSLFLAGCLCDSVDWSSPILWRAPSRSSSDGTGHGRIPDGPPKNSVSFVSMCVYRCERDLKFAILVCCRVARRRCAANTRCQLISPHHRNLPRPQRHHNEQGRIQTASHGRRRSQRGIMYIVPANVC